MLSIRLSLHLTSLRTLKPSLRHRQSLAQSSPSWASKNFRQKNSSNHSWAVQIQLQGISSERWGRAASPREPALFILLPSCSTEMGLALKELSPGNSSSMPLPVAVTATERTKLFKQAVLLKINDIKLQTVTAGTQHLSLENFWAHNYGKRITEKQCFGHGHVVLHVPTSWAPAPPDTPLTFESHSFPVSPINRYFVVPCSQRILGIAVLKLSLCIS